MLRRRCIVYYLKALLADERHNLLFAGYQAKGTVGQIINTAPKVATRHTDQKRLLNFAICMRY